MPLPPAQASAVSKGIREHLTFLLGPIGLSMPLSKLFSDPFFGNVLQTVHDALLTVSTLHFEHGTWRVAQG